MLGKPTLRYKDKRSGYEDFTAEWHTIEDLESILRRLASHIGLGFKPEELE
ncbi:hypothetical protein KEJ36_02955 [Candidatus Bathyarchaeota archaeon]|nr:hypothetical protein [Candidatus Bathyarchaeota archaeon]MBS7627763.1 hypothetical protein [Candidatus Bathyarchaeota archaeon]